MPDEGLFVPPTLIRLDAIEDLKEEWFGPLLHVATWKGGQLPETVRRVNASGFGLTMGLHSRIARAAETVEESATVGNLYVNRSMIGAIVGSQPFGGEGQSGTGPKAGGPHYLPRFCNERVTSTDTTSSGRECDLAEPGGCRLLELFPGEGRGPGLPSVPLDPGFRRGTACSSRDPSLSSTRRLPLRLRRCPLPLALSPD